MYVILFAYGNSYCSGILLFVLLDEVDKLS